MIKKVIGKVKNKIFGPEGFSGRINRIKCDNIYKKRYSPSFETNSYVLVEGMWDNPNHWNRLSLFGSVLAEKHNSSLLGIVRPGQHRSVIKSMKALGVKKIISLLDGNRFRKESKNITEEIIRDLKCPEDLVHAKLPYDIPAFRLYDTILKRQRRAEVDQNHKNFKSLIQEFIQIALNVGYIFDRYNIKEVASNHSVSLYWSALAWLPIQRNVPCFIMDTYNGSIRINRITKSSDYFSPNDSPDKKFKYILDQDTKNVLIERGKIFLEERFNGKSLDLGGRLAYFHSALRLCKKELCNRFSWDERVPVVGIMMCNWFDFPHTLGMLNFANVADWIRATVNVIKVRRDVQWLIKPHPAEFRWYGGPSIQSVIGGHLPSHIRYFPDDIHSLTLLDCAEGIITPHGTSGIEYACYAKKVLLADRSFYSDWGFCYTPESRDHYIRMLKQFPSNINVLPSQINDSLLYAGLFIAPAKGTPKKYLYPCDSGSYKVYEVLPKFLEENKENFPKEQEFMKKWINSEYNSYHAYKAALAVGWSDR